MRKLAYPKLNRMLRPALRRYEHLKPATHLHWTGRLDWARLRVLEGQVVWERPTQKELAGQGEQVWLRMERSPTEPALQMQSPRWLLPVLFVVELDGQPVQMVPPCWVMYVPD